VTLRRPIRVTVDANSLAWGWSGIPKTIDRIVRELARDDGLELELLANAGAPFTDIEGVRQVWRRLKGGTAWRNSFVLGRLLRERPDVFWAPETAMPLWVPVPSVATVHDLAPLIFPGSKPPRATLAHRTTLPRGARSASRVIAVSETTADDVRRLWGVAPERLRVVPNGVDEAFTPGDRAQASSLVAARWGISGPYVLHVGMLDPRKGLDVLLDAAEAEWGDGAGWSLVLAGSPGFASDALLARATAAPWCALLGRVTDEELVTLYRGAEVLGAPSHYEGFGITPVEAMACGTPVVIAAGSGGLVEVSGPAAVVVPERTAPAWRRGVAEARRRRDELAAAGSARAARYRWPAVAAATRDVLLEAAGAE